MPTYVYECSSCQNQFEVEQRISESPLTSCSCGSEGTVKRVIQPIAVMFKGSGFHINDYKGSSAPATGGTATAEAPAATEAASCTGDKGTCGCNPANN